MTLTPALRGVEEIHMLVHMSVTASAALSLVSHGELLAVMCEAFIKAPVCLGRARLN